VPCPSATDPANVTLGHKSVQRWNLPDGWVISSRPAHPALVSEDDYVLRRASARPAARSRTTSQRSAGTCWPGWIGESAGALLVALTT